MQGVALDTSMCEHRIPLSCCIQPYAIFPKCKLVEAVNYRPFSQPPYFPLYCASENPKPGKNQLF